MDDEEERGSLRYLTADAWLRSVIADSWAMAQQDAEQRPYFETEGLARIWLLIAGNALHNEVLH
jgi:hypothetical protein